MTVVSSSAVTTGLPGSWIDGAPVVTGGAEHVVVNPATGAPVATMALAQPADAVAPPA